MEYALFWIVVFTAWVSVLGFGAMICTILFGE